jgi:hypothetical protein
MNEAELREHVQRQHGHGPTYGAQTPIREVENEHNADHKSFWLGTVLQAPPPIRIPSKS